MDNELKRKIDVSIKRLQSFCPEEGYYLAFSGGKDSVVCKRLLEMSGCKFDSHYRVTSVDPPELVRFIKDVHGDVAREIPHYPDGKPITMWNLIEKMRILPTRTKRYCCQKLKEDGGDGRKTVTGVRWEESRNRELNQGAVTIYGGKEHIGSEIEQSDFFAKTLKGGVVLVNDNEESRRMIEQCYKRSKTVVNPIIEWTDQDVWDFIREENIPYCSLYDEGFSRLGCIGCPMAGKGRFAQFARWSKYKQMYLRAIEKMIEAREQAGVPLNKYRTVDDIWHWWMEDGVVPGQIALFDESEVEL